MWRRFSAKHRRAGLHKFPQPTLLAAHRFRFELGYGSEFRVETLSTPDAYAAAAAPALSPIVLAKWATTVAISSKARCAALEEKRLLIEYQPLISL